MISMAHSPEGQLVAMALFFIGPTTLYGRNWGIKPEFENMYPGLHFELCYYRGMEYCMANQLNTFEAGAQGEHKLLRGFLPELIQAAYHLRHPQAFDIIRAHTQEEIIHVQQQQLKLREVLPYKNL